MIKKLLFTISFLLAGFSGLAWAVPSISSTDNDTFVDGESRTISGSGFGTKATAAPVKFDDFDDGVDGNAIGTSSFWSDSGDVTYNNDNLRLGSGLNAKCVLNSSVDGTKDYFFNNTAFGTDNIYVNFWVKFNSGTGASGRQVKLWRVQSGTGFGTAHYPSIGDFNTVYTSSQWSYYQISYDTSGAETFNHVHYTDDVWFNLEAQIKVESSAGALDGELKTWINNVQDLNETGLKMMNTNKDIPVIRIGESVVKGGDEVTQYFDDVYIDDAWNRVYLGNASTYAGSTVKEIQPPTAWSASSVTITVNQGSFGANDDAWVYVCDASGDCNSSGHAITFGTGDPEPSVSNVTGVTGGTLDDGENIQVTGSGFEASQGSGDVVITDNNLTVSQTINTWSDTSIDIDVVQSTFEAGSFNNVRVKNNSGSWSSGFQVQFTPPPVGVGTETSIKGGTNVTGAYTISFIDRSGE